MSPQSIQNTRQTEQKVLTSHKQELIPLNNQSGAIPKQL